jgi:type IV secretory pathway VirB3-like protein
MSQELFIPETVTIPPGLVKPRTMLGVPTEAALVTLVLGAIPIVAFQSFWVLPVPLVLWGFLRYQAAKDAAFLSIWAGQLQFADYYHG